METMVKISKWIEKYMAVIVLLIAVVSLFVPVSFKWIDTSWINYLLMIVMFGMGLTIKPTDFAIVFTRPKDIIVGCVSQFVFMPLIAFLLCKRFSLDDALTAGVVLVGTCPGGTASNVITYMSKGDVALSVGMTSVNTLLAPLLTPLITFLILRTRVEVNILSMVISILQVVVLPIVVAFIVNRFLKKFTEKAVSIMPMISTIGICLIIGSVVSHNSEKIFGTGLVIFAVVILHNLLGYLCGFAVGKCFKMPPAKVKAVSIEIGMQNAGLATSLATSTFPTLAMATVPGAIFSIWHNLSGAILAAIYRRWKDNSQDKKDNEETYGEK